jgi:hypothetical protein
MIREQMIAIKQGQEFMIKHYDYIKVSQCQPVFRIYCKKYSTLKSLKHRINHLQYISYFVTLSTKRLSVVCTLWMVRFILLI